MFVGLARFDIHIPGSSSLKDKRSTVKSMTERIRRRINSAVSEVDFHDLWQRAAIGVAVVGRTEAQVREALEAVQNEIERYDEVVVTMTEKSIFPHEQS